MTNTDRLVLSAFSSYIKGEKFSDIKEINDDNFFSFVQKAAAHKILPMVFECLAGEELPLSDEKLKAARSLVKGIVAEQSAKTVEFIKLYSSLRASGITPLCLKGIVCGCNYPEPDFRSAGDADIFVAQKEFDICRKKLEEYGLTPKSPMEEADEISYYSASGLKLELHRSLFSSDSSFFSHLNSFFSSAFSNAVEINISGLEILTLPVQQNMLYLILHAFKHFIFAGTGIRQICDIALFAEKYGDKIDWEKLFADCGTVKADCFFNAIFLICSRFFTENSEKYVNSLSGFDFRLDISDMLDDIMSGAVYGADNMPRRHSAAITSARLEAEKNVRRAPVMASLFPPADSIKARYPYLQKHPFLLPLAWFERAVKFSGEKVSSKDILKIGRERSELLRKYKITDN